MITADWIRSQIAEIDTRLEGLAAGRSLLEQLRDRMANSTPQP